MFRQIAASLLRVPARPPAARTFVSFARPLSRPVPAMPARLAMPGLAAGARAAEGPASGPVSIFDIVSQQRRFKSRGNTYQPSMLKRKRRTGFLARLRTRGGRKILARRREKGRWFLTY